MQPSRIANVAPYTAANVMVTRPKTMTLASTVAEVRQVFRDDHVHMLLLCEGARLAGTIVRSDVPDSADPSSPAHAWARLEGRVTTPMTPVKDLLSSMQASQSRRLAVVDPCGRLLGLVCLKRERMGFCSDKDVLARATD